MRDHEVTAGRPASIAWLVAVRRRLAGRGFAAVLTLATALGAAAGLLSVAFWNAIAALDAALNYYLASGLDRALPMPAGLQWRVFLPALGAGLAALAAMYVFRTPARLGVASVMLDARQQWGQIPFRYVPATFVNSVLTIGSGGSAGREAPVVAIGGGLGAWVARWLRASPNQRRLLVGCGAAAAIAAAFNAPLAGVFFALEVVLGEWSAATLSPVMLAAVAGTVVCQAAEGNVSAGHFRVPAYELVAWWEVGLYVGLGVVAGLGGVLFRRSTELAERFFNSLPWQGWWRASLGGLGVGILGLLLPGILGNGQETTAAACLGELPQQLLLALAAGKIIATALTLGSGGWGGDFAPTLFVGAMLGGAYGRGLEAVLGHAMAGAGAYAMVGMGGVLAAVVRCPATAVLLLFEMTSSYQVILPIMVCVATATFVARRFDVLGLYHHQLRALGGPVDDARPGDGLEEVAVRALMRPVEVTLDERASLSEALTAMAETGQHVVPVVGVNGECGSVLRLADLRAILAGTERGLPVVAADLGVECPLVTPSTPVREAAEHLVGGWDELVVVASEADRWPCGLVARRDVLRATIRRCSPPSELGADSDANLG
ncbi:MAG: chloride channel protein [Thermoanaerobaculaceae bacterium]|nr:chloride channel protein [Thermoanaerobaculaceae bacterium]MDI9620484.1 chloride channel protein [Acidobacteriota bacterium]NLH12722.1 CBS domain-containing protein [Holophagae bacterium]